MFTLRADEICHPNKVVLLQPPHISESGSSAFLVVAANYAMQSHRDTLASDPAKMAALLWRGSSLMIVQLGNVINLSYGRQILVAYGVRCQRIETGCWVARALRR